MNTTLHQNASLLTAPEGSIVYDPTEHTFTKNGVTYKDRSVTQVLKRVGRIDDRWYDDWCRDRGTFVHQALQHYMEAGFGPGGLWLDQLDPAITGYVQAGINFLGETGFEPWVVEQPFVDEDLGFCGVPDVFGTWREDTSWFREVIATLMRALGLRNSWTLIDWKTGAPEDWHDWQHAAYGLAAQRNPETFIQKPTIQMTIKLNSDGTWRHKFAFQKKSRAQAEGEFVAFLTTLNLQKGDYGL